MYGSDKQIAWAKDIINSCLNGNDSFPGLLLASKLCGEKKMVNLKTEVDTAIEKITSCKFAEEIIDARGSITDPNGFKFINKNF